MRLPRPSAPRRLWFLVKPTVMALVSAWLVIVGFLLITAGIIVYSMPCGMVAGGICAIVLEWHIGVEQRRRR